MEESKGIGRGSRLPERGGCVKGCSNVGFREDFREKGGREGNLLKKGGI